MLVSRLLNTSIRRVAVLSLSVLGATTVGQSWAEESCFPTINKSEPQYIIAFGSLMQSAAREKKLNKAEVEFPVWVRGYERGWFARDTIRAVQKTALAVKPEPGKKFNGLLLQSSSSQIASIDRGDAIMCREKIDSRKLQAMTSAKLPERGQFWIYTARKANIKKPAGQFPMLQSEVDVFLTGCIEQAKAFNLSEFSSQCVKSTSGWSLHWNNDRDRPSGKLVTAKRPEIDQLLEQVEGNLFDRIRQE